MATNRYLRIQSNRVGDAGIVVDGTIWKWVSGGLDAAAFGMPTLSPRFSAPNGVDEFVKYGEDASPREVSLQLRAKETTPALLTARLATMAQMISDIRAYGGTVRYRPDGLNYGVTLDAIFAADSTGMWSHGAEAFKRQDVGLTLTVQPWARHDPMRVEDDFNAATFTTGGVYNHLGSDWTVDAGAVGNFQIVSGRLETLANLSTENRYIHTGTQWSYADPYAQIVVHTGPSTANAKWGVILKRVDANNYIEAYIDYSAGWRVRVDTIVAGVRTNKYSNPVATSGMVYLAGAVIGNRLHVSTGVVESEAVRGMQPLTRVSPPLTTAEAAVLGAGVRGRCGIVATPVVAESAIAWFVAQDGMVNGGAVVPSSTRLSAAIPSAASPSFDLRADVGTVPTPGRSFMCVGWWDRRGPYSYVDCLRSASALTCYSSAIVAGVQTAAGGAAPYADYTTVSKSTSNAYGVVFKATAATDAGGTWRDRGRLYRAGITYRVKARVSLVSGSGTIRVKLGASGDIALGSPVTLSSSFQDITVDWTPQSDIFSPYVAFVTTAVATAEWLVSGLRVFEVEGSLDADYSSGGYLPFGVLPAASSIITPGGGAALTVDASALTGFTIERAGAGTLVVQVPITTCGLGGSSDTATVDLFVMLKHASTITGINVQASLTGNEYMSRQTYSEPFGSAGRTVTVMPTAGTVYRYYYVGRLTISKIDVQRVLQIDATVTGAGAFGVDHLLGVPVGSGIMTPTGIVQTNYGGDIFGSTIRSDLSVESAAGQTRGARFGGSPLRMPSGAKPEFLVAAADAILPDATDSSAITNNVFFNVVHMSAAIQPRVHLAELLT